MGQGAALSRQLSAISFQRAGVEYRGAPAETGS